MGGFAFDIYDEDATLTVEESLFELSTNPNYVLRVPTLDTCIYLVEHFPSVFTNIPEEYILQRAQSSSLSKALLIVQVGWFCTNCASRHFQHLPLSLLEVTTAAHALCTLLTYFVWWSKPFNIMAPTIIKGKKAQEVHALLDCPPKEFTEALEMAQRMAAGDFSMRTEGNKRDRIVLAANLLQHCLTAKEPPGSPTYNSDDALLPGALVNSNNWGMEWMTITISPILYGLVHFMAWSDNFPTPKERLFWHASSVVVTCSGFIGTLGATLGFFLERREQSHIGLIRTIIGRSSFAMGATVIFIIPIIHTLASGFLIIESFRQLFFLNPAVYQAPSWSNYWPHLS